MKSIKCRACSGQWYVDDKDLDRQNQCPYCATSIREKVDFKKYDTLGKLIYGAVSERGMEILDNHDQLKGWMMDVSSGLDTDVRIFSKNINDRYMGYVKEAFNQSGKDEDVTIKKLDELLKENEGLSDSWAEELSEGVREASSYINGNAATQLVNVDVEDFDMEAALIYMADAAKQGYVGAQEILGRWYVEDYNLPEMGIKWLNKASEQGSKQAKTILRQAYNKVTSAYWLMNSPETEKMLTVYKSDSFVIVELESVKLDYLYKLAKHFSKLLNIPELMIATKNFKVDGKKDKGTWACVAYFDSESDKVELLKNGYEKKVKKGKNAGTYTVFVKDNDFERYKQEIQEDFK